jgi:hypothetical protein
MIVLLITFLYFILLCLGYINSQEHRYEIASLSFKEMVQKLHPMPYDAIEAIASSHLNPSLNPIDPVAALVAIGDLPGLKRMRDNGELLIAIADDASNWYRDAGDVADQLRHELTTIKRAGWIALALYVFGGCRGYFGPSILASVAAYHLMTQRLLVLYENTHLARYIELKAAFTQARTWDINAIKI